MKLTLIFCLVITFVAATPVKDKYQRRYDPQEENIYRRKWIVMQDGDGKYHLVDLTRKPDPSYRASAADVTFYLYTKNNPENADIISGTNFDALSNTNFISSRKSVFISHGWNNNYLSGVNTNIRPAIIDTEDVNLFVVDWSGPANEFYTTAMDAVPTVGKVVGDLINHIISSYGVSTSQVYLIGHSLGAHVAGCAGAAVNGLVNSIVGLDPAGPLFTIGNIDNRLDTSDADFVHIIHTNSGLLGFGSSIGHVDFFPNGGSSQAGCGIDLIGTCAHRRSHEFYAESVRSSGFLGTRCTSQSSLENGSCSGNPTSFMGHFEVDKSASGDYYLTTGSASPFALG